VGEILVAAAGGALVAQGVDADGGDIDLLPRAGSAWAANQPTHSRQTRFGRG
jgi:hypothetical protein